MGWQALDRAMLTVFPPVSRLHTKQSKTVVSSSLMFKTLTCGWCLFFSLNSVNHCFSKNIMLSTSIILMQRVYLVSQDTSFGWFWGSRCCPLSDRAATMFQSFDTHQISHFLLFPLQAPMRGSPWWGANTVGPTTAGRDVAAAPSTVDAWRY